MRFINFVLIIVALNYLFQGPQKVKYGKVGFSETEITAKDIIIATGSVPFIPKGIEIDGMIIICPRRDSIAVWVIYRL